MPGLADPRHCGTLLFYRGCHGFLFQCSIPSPPPQRRQRFMFSWAFIRGSHFNQCVPITSGSVRVACHNLTCGGGIFFWLRHKKSPDTKWYLPPQAPANTSFCTRIFSTKARTSLFCRPTPFRCQATHTTTLSLDA